ncbi:alcohol oxidase [Coniophora puteana RWD-64-598 SS2]|uniref:Alcohol oxidase n=1 Tax=Coniophora puteana (strain RWD-64-598) TaxID=741705 RepID=R7SEF4_CONPW|nr:alcohol oxidase [Coniophora puteana RWD-64-598 SS2]EIW74566.1 alcohol oxidase [Coniophora puteana RWD-64-598 SS2]
MSTYDFVIIGGGTAGLVLAKRLSEDGTFSVLVLEAGHAPTPEQAPLVDMTAMAFKLMETNTLMRSYPTPPQAVLGGNTFDIQAGWGLGGSSNVNFAMWMRGAKVDYDRIADITGDASWTFDALMPYFRKSETYHFPSSRERTVQAELHGEGGPIHLHCAPATSRWSDDSLRAYQESGLPFNEDTNGGQTLGIGPVAANNYFPAGGRSSSRKYVETPRHANLAIKEGAQVARVVFEGKKAIGVETVSGEVFRAAKEVILSAGTFQSPAILQRSGVGPASLLNSLGIPLVHDLPGVGENMWDHFLTVLRWRLKDEYRGGTFDDLANPELLQAALGRYQQDGSGLLGGTVSEWGIWRNFSQEIEAAVKADDSLTSKSRAHLLASTTPHAQLFHFHGYLLDPHPSASHAHFSVFPVVVSPTSRGTIRITSSDPTQDPVVDPRWLSTATDRAVLEAGIRFANEVASGEVWRDKVEREVAPTEDAVGFDDTNIEAKIRGGRTMYHFSGTCAMASPDSEEVLPVTNSACEVYGVECLRVVDASVLPAPISAPTQAVTYAIAEKIADVIKHKYAN